MRHLPRCGVALVLLSGGFLAAALSLPLWAAEAQPAESLSAHFAKGEVQYDNQWVSIDNLFKDYLNARSLLQGAADKVNASRAKVMEVQRRITELKNDAATAERPTRVAMGKARAKRSEYNKALEAKPPRQPTLLQVPPAPRQPAYSSRSSSGSYSSGTSGYDDQQERYDQARRNWQAQADAINRQNDQAKKDYQDKLREYTKAKNEATKELPKVEASIKQCEGKLEQSASDVQAKVAPLIEESKAANDTVTTLQAQSQMAEKRVKNIADAIRGAPDAVRFQHGVIEWEGTFSTFAELEKLYTGTQTEIDRVREQLKEETTKAGQPFPPNWRHPQLDRMDALKAILDKAKAGSAAAKPAA